MAYRLLAPRFDASRWLIGRCPSLSFIRPRLIPPGNGLDVVYFYRNVRLNSSTFFAADQFSLDNCAVKIADKGETQSVNVCHKVRLGDIYWAPEEVLILYALKP